MTTIRPGDYIRHRNNGAIWRVLAVNPDGTLRVEFYASACYKRMRQKLITRPEDYRKIDEVKK